MIPKAIGQEHVLAALAAIDQDRGAPGRESGQFHLVYAGRRYPPKVVVSLTWREATGRLLPSELFSGDAENNRFLVAVEFKVVGTSGGRVVARRTEARLSSIGWKLVGSSRSGYPTPAPKARERRWARS